LSYINEEGQLAAIAAAAHPISTGEEVVNNAIDEILALGRVKGKTVFDVMQVFPQNVRQHCAVISGLPVTQVSVERLFFSTEATSHGHQITSERGHPAGSVIPACPRCRVKNLYAAFGFLCICCSAV